MNVQLSAGLLRSLGPAVSGRGRLSILIYHQVLPRLDPMRPDEVDAATFDWQMRLVASCFNVLPLEEAIQRLHDRTLPPRAACITFDDGYADNLTIAAPIFKRYGLTATFFVATGFLDGGRMWNDSIIESVRVAPGTVLDLERIGLGRYPVGAPEERTATAYAVIRAVKHLPPDVRATRVAEIVGAIGMPIPDDLMLTSSQVRELRAQGMTIGGHTVTHPILASTEETGARREILDGKERLEAILGEPVRLFAYPNGKPGQDFRAEHVRMVCECGFRGAVSTSWGAANYTSDPYQLPRFLPWDRSPGRFALRLAQNWLQTPEMAT
jgi:peptidoglycan/xylan/chitin deacetylase (PgdA/CDA1 family)